MRLLLTLIVLTVFISCKSNKSETPTDTDTATAPKAFEFKNGDYFRKGYTQEEERYKLVPAGKSEKFPKAKIESFKWEDGKANFEISGYELGVQTPDADSKNCANSADGQHIHFIVDDKDYLAKYTTEFEAPISDGQHYLLSFLSRSYHESIKNPDAAYHKFVEIEDGKITHEWEIPEPTIFFSRPKGTYTGVDTKRVLLDFYPVNCEIGKDAWVEVYINGEFKILNEWKAYFIEGLVPGENSVALRLVDEYGDQIVGKQSAIRKLIKIVPDPTENAQ